MKRLAVLLLALLAPACLASPPQTSAATSSGAGGMGGAGGGGGAGGEPMDLAYPCGFVGSPMEARCHDMVPPAVPYCARDAQTPMPFPDCTAEAPIDDAGAAQWWCCPFN